MILLALIARGVAFKFRNSETNPTWRSYWDWAIFIGSLVPALLWGVAFGNLSNGTPIDANMNFTGNFLDLLNPYSLVCGLASLSVFTLHGALFLSLKTDGVLRRRAEAQRGVAGASRRGQHHPGAANYLCLDMWWACPNVIDRDRRGAAARGISQTVRLVVRDDRADDRPGAGDLLLVHDPNVMISSTDEAYNLTVDDASSATIRWRSCRS